jgi:hypothetical protein
VTEPGGMNALIRAAARGGAISQPEQPVEQPGSIGIGVGGAGVAPPSDPHAQLNERLRIAHALVRGQLSIDAVLGPSAHGNW